ncbi:MAG: 7TM diverse intracellular signaling domain-containing protein [Rhodoferax sp.]|nr:7TM diverse intracellular signaling domain-containing protein [Rhodoferax sp.]MDP3650943.1 7TM diverse intracellular signaling domain-containing protein [Rhodoferax sp.]
MVPPQHLGLAWWHQRCAMLALLLVLLLGGAFTKPALAANTAAPPAVEVGHLGQAPLTLTPFVQVLEDPGGTLTLADVQAPALAERFASVPAPERPLGFGTTSSAYWLKIRLHNGSDQAQALMLEVAYARLAHIDFHQQTEGQTYQSTATGSLHPFAQRPYPHHFFVLPVSLAAQTDKTVYLRVQTANTMNIPALLWARDAFHAYERTDYVTQAGYFGIVLAMALFNLLLWIALRDVNYLLYVGFVSAMAVTMAALNGMGLEFVWSESPQWTTWITLVGPSVTLAALLLFTRRMLATPRYVPRLDVALQVLVIVNCVLPLGLLTAFPLFIKPTFVVIAVAAILILAAGLLCAWQRQRSAYFFVAAFAVLCLALIMGTLRSFGIGPSMVVTTNGIQLGSAIEMLLLAFALADRFNVLRREKEDAQAQALAAQRGMLETLQSSEKQLEARVNTRTAELSATVLRLRQTQHELVQSEKLASLGSLVAGVAHELNTPIGNALLTATTLQGRIAQLGTTLARGELRRSSMESFVQESDEMAQLVSRSVQRAAQLISSFKQVAVDQTSEQRRKFDLLVLVEDNIAALRPGYRHVPWTIQVDIAPGIGCDSFPGPLGQVCTNMVQNAALHAFPGAVGGTLRISAQASEQEVEMHFADDGVGMDADTLARVFEPFFTTRLGQGGSGLGLSVSLNIANGLLGGSLSVQSHPGQGSCFTLKFPRIAPDIAR